MLQVARLDDFKPVSCHVVKFSIKCLQCGFFQFGTNDCVPWDVFVIGHGHYSFGNFCCHDVQELGVAGLNVFGNGVNVGGWN